MTRKLVAIFVAVFWVALAARSHVYLNLEAANVTTLHDSSEAYLFVEVDHLGHRIRALRFPLLLLENYLGGVEDPDDHADSLDVIHVTPSRVEYHVLKIEDRGPGTRPSMYTPLEGRIYLNYNAAGGLCWWNHDHFEPPTERERQRILGDHLLQEDNDGDVNGWSKTRFGTVPFAWRTAKIDGGHEFALWLSTNANLGGSSDLSIRLIRPGRSTEVIWSRHLMWGMVTPGYYQRIFFDGR